MTMLSILRRFGTLIGFALILGVFWVSLPDTFMTARNWLNITQQLSMLTVVAAGMTIVMVMDDFDLSVGSTASLAGIVAAVAFTAGFGIPEAGRYEIRLTVDDILLGSIPFSAVRPS